MILELAVGDAYGAGFEYVDESTVRKFNNLGGYRKHQKYNIGNGRYTDDTQLSLAIAELLVEGVAWAPLNIANKFVEAFKRDPREGYAGRFYQFLQEVNTGREFLERINPESDKSGAAMRTAPIGFLPEMKQVINYATIQARLTHNTPLGINAAVASALMSHYFIYNLGKKENLGIFLESHVEGDWNQPWVGKVGDKGYMDVRAAVTAINKEDSLSGILRRSIDFTGDVDTVATIALAAASNSREIKQDLPMNLVSSLENGTYGREYLIELDKKLKQKFSGRKMFNKIILLLKQGLKVEVKTIERIQKIFSNAETKIITFDDLKKSDLKDANLIITLGGDGTFVKAANLIENSFILGINAEPDKSEGALTSIDILALDKLEEITKGNYEIIKRHRAKVKLNGNLLDEHALNEVYLGATSQFHSSRYKIKFRDIEEEHRSSGVIISTGTGSPAWFYSAGGKVFNHDEEKLGFIVREPYFGKRIFTPKLLGGHIENGEKLIIESMRNFGGILAINDATYDFNKGDIAEITLSDKPLSVIKPK